MQPDTPASIEFLKKFCGENSVLITAIPLGTNPKLIGELFTPENLEDKGRAFIERYNGTCNMYFGVNPLKSSITKVTKSSKDQIASMDWLHIDLDPDATDEEGREKERKNILAKLEAFTPSPTVILDSGGGYQAFWKLEQPLIINNKDDIINHEAYNQQLSILLGGDHCHNIDRIMRLPGTVNLPTPTKVKKGRVKALSKLIKFESALQYPISQFDKAITVGPVSVEEKVNIGNIPTDVDIDALPISDHCRVIIIHGQDPEEPEKWPSRSEPLFYVVCEMLRKQQPDNVIASVIMNPEFKISESVLEKRRPEDYAAKQIRDAKVAIVSPELLELNSKHCVVMEGGKVRILTEKHDYVMDRSILARSVAADFRTFYMNRMVVVGQKKNGMDITEDLGKWWLTHPSRRQYEDIVFSPGKEVAHAYNLWRGFSVEAVPGDWSIFKQHLLENICGNVQEYFDYLIGWMATCVQFPAQPGQVAIVLRGPKGTGKSKFAKVFGGLLGQHFLHIGNPKHLTGNFNQHLRDTVVLFADEALWAGDKQGEGVLKMLITEETLVIEGKGVDPICCSNFVHLIMASNHDWVVPAGNAERRYFVLDVSDAKAQDTKFFAALDEQMFKQRGNEALLHYLLHYDLSNFNLRKVPKTSALETQQSLSLPAEQTWWEYKLREGKLMDIHDSWRIKVSKSDLYKNYVDDMLNRGVNHRLSNIAFGHFLKKMLNRSPDWPKSRQENTNGSRPWVYVFPDLAKCRGMYSDMTGTKYNWPDVGEGGGQQEEEDVIPF